MFDERAARDDLRRYRKDGAAWATRELIDELASGVVLEGASVIDIGAGIGVVHLELLRRGAAQAVDIDGSSAYLAAARGEAERQGLGDRVEHVLGDATVVGDGVTPADLVALDRVICCFGDLPGLLGAATSLATRRVGLVYPRDSWWTRLAATIGNPLILSRRNGFRFRVHRRSTVATLLRQAGFAPLADRAGAIWRVETWERVPAPGDAA